MRKLTWLAILLMPLLVAAQTVEPTVQAVLFYSPTCPHCHQVITELLVPMQEEYGDRLEILGVDTTNAAGAQLYQNAIDYFEIPQDRLGVPTLIVGSTILVGSGEIPGKFPDIVKTGLAAGGIGWPAIPELALIVPDLSPSAGPDAAVAASSANHAATAAPNESAGTDLQEASEAIASAETEDAPPADPVGFALAWIVLLGMVAALVYAGYHFLVTRPQRRQNPGSGAPMNTNWGIPVLALIGLGVALYLAYVETTGVAAVCGPVGECNIVQSSTYARIAGIPVAVLGALSYLAIIGLWAAQHWLSGRAAALAGQALLFLTMFGVLFSIYLTLLELFAIGAICAWCLSSAVLTTLIMFLVVRDFTMPQPAGKMQVQTQKR